MAVVTADPLDIALAELGELAGDARQGTLEGASVIAGLWQRVYERAMDRCDVPLAIVAAREWINAMRLIRTVIRSSTSPPTD